MRIGRLIGLALGLIAIYEGCSSTGPNTASRTAMVAGSWFDSTDFGDVDPLTITTNGSSVTVVSPAYYLPFSWDGVNWWGREGTPDTATGTIGSESLALCDHGLGPPCPNEIAYLRGGSLVLYFAITIDGNPADSSHTGATFVHGLWSSADTIPPLNAPPPVELTGVWLSDSVAPSCPAIAQIGLVVPGAFDSGGPSTLFQVAAPLYEPQGWTRQCGTTTWTSRGGKTLDESDYGMIPFPFPCTPADNCLLLFADLDSTKADNWFVTVPSADSLADETPSVVNAGPLAAYFLRDGNATSLTLRAAGAPRRWATISHRDALLARWRALRRSRAQNSHAIHPLTQRLH